MWQKKPTRYDTEHGAVRAGKHKKNTVSSNGIALKATLLVVPAVPGMNMVGQVQQVNADGTVRVRWYNPDTVSRDPVTGVAEVASWTEKVAPSFLLVVKDQRGQYRPG